MDNKLYSNLLIDENESLMCAMRQMDDIGRKLLIVSKDNKFSKLISIGDIQRAIIRNIHLNSKISGINRTENLVANKDTTETEIKEMMLSIRAEFLPIIDEYGNILKVCFWNEYFDTKKSLKKYYLKNDVVIMAGGLGSRVLPLTSVIPKPLLPINGKTFIEEIVSRFTEYSIQKFYLSVNYKSDLIQFYINQLNLPVKIEYINEDVPRGTIGSVKTISENLKNPFFVSNCDTLINADYGEIVEFHEHSRFDITIVAAITSSISEYGTIVTGDSGELISIDEKPTTNQKINTGIYLINPETLKFIPTVGIFHVTDLIKSVQSSGGRIGVYPISERSWNDFGTLNSYLKKIQK